MSTKLHLPKAIEAALRSVATSCGLRAPWLCA